MSEFDRESVDGTSESRYVLVQSVDGELFASYLVVEHEHAVEAGLDVLVELGQSCLRLFSCFGSGCLLVAQFGFLVHLLLRRLA